MILVPVLLFFAVLAALSLWTERRRSLPLEETGGGTALRAAWLCLPAGGGPLGYAVSPGYPSSACAAVFDIGNGDGRFCSVCHDGNVFRDHAGSAPGEGEGREHGGGSKS